VRDTVEERHGLFVRNRYAGYTVCNNAGAKIGKVEGILVDDDEQTEYLGVKIDSPESRSTLIPLDVARVNEQRRIVEIVVSREWVEGALALDDGGEMTLDFEQQVRSFFGVTNDGTLEVPPVDWMVPFLLVRLREGDCQAHELARKATYPDFQASRPRMTYRTLQQMEKEGMVVSRGDDFDREVSQRRYSITEWGNACLECMANAIGQYGEEIDLFFRLFNEYLASEPRLEQVQPRSERETRNDAQAPRY
jgi:DNA-binding PadR family transcriptional regulator